jgi:two-component system, LytTR family, sensor histidine kinase AlgZ
MFLASPVAHADNETNAVPCSRHELCIRLPYMRPIIRQNSDLPALPDFRNLGTILRILIAVNAAAAIAAIVQTPRLELWAAQWLDNISLLEPHLMLQLALLYGLSPWLARQPYATGAWLVAGITVVCGLAVHVLIEATRIVRGGDLLRDLVLGLLACGALLGYFRLRARALSPAVTEARLQALQARIRPHFLFNSITAVLSLMRENPRQAEAALEDLADLFRVLMRDNRDLVPLADELELCRQYLALEKLRLGDRLQVEWHLNSMPGDALVPPLVLQPLLENAVYHGIEPLSGPGVVSINIFIKSGDVHAILRNPYQANGGRHHAGNKMAIGNVRERLALHFDAEGSLDSKVVGSSYEVHLRMPYRPSNSVAVHRPTPKGADGTGSPPPDSEDNAPMRSMAAVGEGSHV